ncbi:MAG: type-F conjugative transfer system pilin assembly protein TraF [Gammaproteobacteria bacterium]
MKLLKLVIYIMTAFSLTSMIVAAYADTDFFDSHAQGWHWYVPEPQDTSIQKNSSPNVTAVQSSIDPLAQVQAISKAVNEAKAEAVLNPTPENVARYIALQNAVTQNAAKFGQAWQQVIWQNPSLNYSLNHPTSQIAKDAYLDSQRQQDNTTLKQIAGQYGLFFFFAGSCPYCHRFAPIVKDLQTQYGFSVIPVSLDGGGLPQYPSPQRDSGQAAKFAVTRWPALFLVDPAKKQIIPVTYGLISEDELTSRIVTLVAQVNAQRSAS